MTEDDQETIFGEENESTADESNGLSLDDITRGQSYVSSEDLEEDGGVQYEIRKLERDENARYTFSEEDYAINIHTQDGRIQTVNSWSLWGAIRQAYREASDAGLDSAKGLHLRVERIGRGEYEVAWSLDGETFNEVEMEE